MIRLDRVCKRFRTRDTWKTVADDMSAVFPTGRAVALLGQNGAGKSTLLQMIAGTQDMDSGRITSTGTISWPVGFGGSFHRELTGAQNVRFIARVYGVDTDSLVAFVEDFAELGGHFHMPTRSYSAGMRSRLAFGVSMGIKFDTYLVDEVTSVGDMKFKRKSKAVFKARMQNAGAIMVSHDMRQVREFCDASCVIHKGKLQYFDNVQSGIDHYNSLMA